VKRPWKVLSCHLRQGSELIVEKEFGEVDISSYVYDSALAIEPPEQTGIVYDVEVVVADVD